MPVELYRKMEVSDDGKPAIGNEPCMLGVRLKDPTNPKRVKDVDATVGTDPVRPGKGLSVDTTAGNIPPTLAGVLWVIDTDVIPLGLDTPQRGKRVTHHQIEPAVEMTLDEYQTLLWGTRDAWQQVTEGDAE